MGDEKFRMKNFEVEENTEIGEKISKSFILFP